MRTFQNTTTSISYQNDNDGRLQVSNHIENALGVLKFNENNGLVSKYKLMIYHGAAAEPLADTKQYAHQVIFLEMGSEGRFGTLPKVEDKDITYYIQGGAGSSRLPSTIEDWQQLIQWLLQLADNGWNLKKPVPLPDDPHLRKFIYTEPIPEELLACYFVAKAREKGCEVQVDEKVKTTARVAFLELSKRLFPSDYNTKQFEATEDLHAVLLRLVAEATGT